MGLGEAAKPGEDDRGTRKRVERVYDRTNWSTAQLNCPLESRGAYLFISTIGVLGTLIRFVNRYLAAKFQYLMSYNN